MSDDIFIKIPVENAFKGATLNEYISKLKLYLADKVEHVYMFGSYATGTAREDSDVDIIIVCETKLPFHERYTLFPKIFDWTNELDLLIYTPSEFEKIKNEEHVGFWKHVFKTLKTII